MAVLAILALVPHSLLKYPAGTPESSQSVSSDVRWYWPGSDVTEAELRRPYGSKLLIFDPAARHQSKARKP